MNIAAHNSEIIHTQWLIVSELWVLWPN